MKITPDIFKAHLKCQMKCRLRANGAPFSGNAYTEWVIAQGNHYRAREKERLATRSANHEVALSPSMNNLESAQWQTALDLTDM